MADFLKECQVAEFQDAFTDVADKGGFIASSQLGAVLRRLGQNPTDAEIQVSDDSHLSNHYLKGDVKCEARNLAANHPP